MRTHHKIPWDFWKRGWKFSRSSWERTNKSIISMNSRESNLLTIAVINSKIIPSPRIELFFWEVQDLPVGYWTQTIQNKYKSLSKALPRVRHGAVFLETRYVDFISWKTKHYGTKILKETLKLWFFTTSELSGGHDILNEGPLLIMPNLYVNTFIKASKPLNGESMPTFLYFPSARSYSMWLLFIGIFEILFCRESTEPLKNWKRLSRAINPLIKIHWETSETWKIDYSLYWER